MSKTLLLVHVLRNGEQTLQKYVKMSPNIYLYCIGKPFIRNDAIRRAWHISSNLKYSCCQYIKREWGRIDTFYKKSIIIMFKDAENVVALP